MKQSKAKFSVVAAKREYPSRARALFEVDYFDSKM